MSAEQIPVKAAPTVRKAPPQVPTVPTAGQPEVGLHVAVQQFLAVVRAGRRGGWRAWEPLVAQIGMEDRTALMEFVAVMSMVPPANAPTAGQIQEHMSTIFPARAATATSQSQEAVPTAAAPTIPAKAYPGAPPSAWAGQVQWPPPRCRERRSSTHLPGHLHRRGRRRHLSWEQSRRAGRSSTCRRWKPSRRCLQEHRRRHLGWSPNTRSTRLGCAQGCRQKGRCTPCLDDNPGRHLAGAAEQRAAAQDTGATSPTTCGANGGRV